MSKGQAKILIYIVAAIALLAIAMMRHSSADVESEQEPFTQIEGTVFHTIYHIQYEGNGDYREELRQLFDEFDASLSMFNDTSLISRINQGDTSVVLDHYLRTVYDKACEVSERTGGAFDITVAPLINLWGFGFKNAENVSPHAVDSILQFVGYQKTHLDERGHLIKDDPRMVFDASSIAKGYMCDVAADFLRSKGLSNFMVEIGGEVVCSGHNARGNLWGIGINEPIEDSLQINTQLRDVMRLTDCGIATSGNYRNFYYKDGRRFGHIVDPSTGYPVQRDILSSTVIAPDCITADALATAFMVLGSESAIEILESDSTLMAYFICSSDKGDKFRVIYSPRLEQMLVSSQLQQRDGKTD